MKLSYMDLSNDFQGFIDEVLSKADIGKIRILLIEDDYVLKEKLEHSTGYDIKHSRSYTSALTYWEKYCGDFDLIILGLNINPNGMDPIDYSKYFPIHGITFLERICCNLSLPPDDTQRKQEEKEIWMKTIIYSDPDHIKKLDNMKNNFSNYYSLNTIVHKNDENSPKVLINKIRCFLGNGN